MAEQRWDLCPNRRPPQGPGQISAKIPSSETKRNIGIRNGYTLKEILEFVIAIHSILRPDTLFSVAKKLR